MGAIAMPIPIDTICIHKHTGCRVIIGPEWNSKYKFKSLRGKPEDIWYNYFVLHSPSHGIKSWGLIGIAPESEFEFIEEK